MPAEGLAVLLRSFRLPTMAAIWEESVGRAERENWGYKRLLQHLCESEEQDRRERKMQRLLKESGLPDGKTLGNLDEKLLPTKIRRLLPTLAGRPLCGAGGEPAGLRSARPGQDAFLGRTGSRIDPAPPLPGALHADVQAGAAVVGRQEGPALGK